MEFKKIGEAKFNRLQVYPLDASSGWHNEPDTIIVPEGAVCDVLRGEMTTIIALKGVLNVGRSFRMGDGIFSMNNSDILSDFPVIVPSRHFGPDEWADILTDDLVAWTFQEAQER